jgi:hypothetical protein
MTLFQRLIATPDAAGGLCRTCTWGTVRAGFFRDEAETFCRLISPGKRLRFAVRDCTDYCDRRMPVSAPPGERKYGFVTEIKLESAELRSTPDKTPESSTR